MAIKHAGGASDFVSVIAVANLQIAVVEDRIVDASVFGGVFVAQVGQGVAAAIGT